MRAARLPALPVALFLAPVLWQVPLLLRAPGVYDEGLTLVGAQRILQGEVPYRDFWNTHAPGQIATVALLFKLFGPSLIVERAYDALVRTAGAVATFALARRLGAARAGALAAWASATVFLASFVNYGYATSPSLLCALAALLLVTRAQAGGPAPEGARRRGVLLAGLAAGGAVLFRHDVGGVAVAAGLLPLWLAPAAAQGEAGGTRGLARARAAAVWQFLAGVAAVTLPVALFFALAGTPWDRVREIFFDYPFRVYPAVRSLPPPAGPASRVALAIPAALVAGGLFLGLRGARRPGADGLRARTLAALAAFAALTFPLAYTRISLTHQITLVVPALAILAGLLTRSGGGRARRTLVTMGAAAALAAMLAEPAANTVADLRRLAARPPRAAAHGIGRARWVALRRAQVETVNTLRAATAAGDAVYVGLGRHDKAFVNDALFYFLADRRCGTYYHNLLPGLVTTERVQQEILADLKRRPGMPLVLFSGADEAAEANLSRVPSGVTLLDRAIRRDYELVGSIPPYGIWRRKSSDAPGGESG